MSEFVKKARACMKTLGDKMRKPDPQQDELSMLRSKRDLLDMKGFKRTKN